MDGAPGGRRTVGACLTWRAHATALLVVVAALCCREWTNVWTTATALGFCAMFLRQLQVARARSARAAWRADAERSGHDARARAA